MSNLHICFGVKKDCYNPFESYGEICVGCGCCQKDKRKRLKARIELHKRLLQENLEFDGWFDDPDIKALQKRNIDSNIAWNKKKIARLKKELDEVKYG